MDIPNSNRTLNMQSQCSTCTWISSNPDVAIIQMWSRSASETVWEFPRKTLEACKNVVTLGKTRLARTRVEKKKCNWINGRPRANPLKPDARCGVKFSRPHILLIKGSTEMQRFMSFISKVWKLQSAGHIPYPR
jgi:hypothetical protein